MRPGGGDRAPTAGSRHSGQDGEKTCRDGGNGYQRLLRQRPPRPTDGRQDMPSAPRPAAI